MIASPFAWPEFREIIDSMLRLSSIGDARLKDLLVWIQTRRAIQVNWAR
jgi:hypothetical protein